MPDVPQNRVRLASSVLRWWRDGIRQHGLLKTVRTLVGEIATFLRDSTPERRRRRYGDVEYDWNHHVNTTSATVTFHDRLLGVFHSPYQPTDPELFSEMIAALIDTSASIGSFSPTLRTPLALSQFCFIDLGSGKGRVLLMAAEYPFRRILGVELLPHLNAVAEENIRKFQSASPNSRHIETVCADALNFPFPPEPTVLYLFNPFPKSVLERVIANLERSLGETPRPIFVLYHNPLLEQVISRTGKLKKLAATHQYVIYGN